MATSFRVGKGIGIVHDSTLALFEPLNGELAVALWELVGSGAGIDELLEELSSTGLRSLGSFAMAQLEGPHTRVVVRGTARVRVKSASGWRDVAANGVRTWVEELIDDAEAVELSIYEPAEGVLPFRAQRALLPADFLQHGISDDLRVQNLATGVVDDFTSNDAFSDLDLSPEPALAQLPIDSGPVSQPVDVQAVPPELEPGSEPEPDEDREPESVPESPPPTDPGRTMTASDLGEYSEPAPPTTDSPVTMPNAIVEPEPDAGDEYDEIYGRTMARTVGGAAVHAPEELPEAAEPSVAVPVGPPAAQWPPATPPPAVSPLAASGLIEGIPSSASPVMGDHDGRTMTKAQIAALRAAQSGAPQPVAASVMGGPTVQALVCPNQHANPPQLQVCRVCRAHLGSLPVQISRPTLGVLRFSNGTTVSLDRPALVGRNPKIEGGLAGEIPQLVKLDVGAGLSRTHASLRLEGWQVLLEDLNSPNGTIVRLPGREPRRLHPGEPVLLEVGSDVDFGGEIRCVLE